MDALDPQDKNEFSEILYKDDSFLKSVITSLSDDGIMVMQLGPAPESPDPAEEYTENANRVLVFETLERFGFASMQVYQEVSIQFFQWKPFFKTFLNQSLCVLIYYCSISLIAVLKILGHSSSRVKILIVGTIGMQVNLRSI